MGPTSDPLVLHLDPTSLPAFQTLLFLHLHTDDYAAALSLLDNPPAAATSLEFERAYCLYRLHREKEALGLMEKLQSDGRKEKHLEAQIVSSTFQLYLAQNCM
jgi:signal recognition particle subunit SRP72